MQVDPWSLPGTCSVIMRAEHSTKASRDEDIHGGVQRSQYHQKTPVLNPKPQTKTSYHLLGPMLSSGSAMQRCLLISLWLFPPPSSTPEMVAKGSFIKDRLGDEPSWRAKWIHREGCAKCLMQEDYCKKHCQSKDVYSLFPEFIEMDTRGALTGWRSPYHHYQLHHGLFLSNHVFHSHWPWIWTWLSLGRQLWGTQWLIQSQRWALRSHSQSAPTLKQEAPCHTCTCACWRPPVSASVLYRREPPKYDAAFWNDQLFLKMSEHWDLPPPEPLWAAFKNNFSPILLW